MAARDAGFTRAEAVPGAAGRRRRHAEGAGRPVPRRDVLPDRRHHRRRPRREFLALPNVACVGGSWLTPRDAIAAGDWRRITALAREAAALATAVLTELAATTKQCMHKIVLLRHGESTWNQENRFTGWTDVGLTDKGSRRRGRGRPAAEARGLRLRRRLHLGAQARDQDAVDRARGDGPDVDPGAPIAGG